MLVSELVNCFDYKYCGLDRSFSGIKFYDEAEKSDIAVCYSEYEMINTEAEIILIKSGIFSTEKTVILSYDNLECAFVRICEELIKRELLPDYNRKVSYSVNGCFYVGNKCAIAEDASIGQGVLIGDNVTIGPKSVIEPFVTIGSGTVIGENVHIKSGSRIGVDSFFHYYDIVGNIHQFNGCGIVAIKNGVTIGYNSVVQRGTISNTIIGENTIIGNLIDIGHDVKIGKQCKIVSQSGIAGGAILKNNVLVYGHSAINNNVVIGNNVIVQARTGVSKSVEDNQVVYGRHGKNYIEELRLEAKIRNFFGRSKT